MVKDIPEGTLVRAKPFGYDEQTGDYAHWDVPDYDAAGIGPVVEGALEKTRSSQGHWGGCMSSGASSLSRSQSRPSR